MAAIGALTLPDGQTTPVNHTFSPVNIDKNGIAKWVDRSGGIAVGFPTLTFSFKDPSKTSANNKIMVKLVLPAVSTDVSGNSTKVYEDLGTIEFTINQASSLARRKDLAAYMAAAIQHAVVQNAVKDLEHVYGG